MRKLSKFGLSAAPSHRRYLRRHGLAWRCLCRWRPSITSWSWWITSFECNTRPRPLKKRKIHLEKQNLVRSRLTTLLYCIALHWIHFIVHNLTGILGTYNFILIVHNLFLHYREENCNKRQKRRRRWKETEANLTSSEQVNFHDKLVR